MEKWNLLAKHLSGNLNTEEQSAFAVWLKENPLHPSLLKEFEKLWNTSTPPDPDTSLDTEAEWQKFRTLAETPVALTKPGISWRTAGYRAAAVLAGIGIFAAVYITFFASGAATPGQATIAQVSPPKPEFTIVHAQDSVRLFLLPDSTKILLNENSSFSYPERLQGPNRTTYLAGEAYFEVVKSDRPFIVYAGGIEVRVLGTAFSLKTGVGAEDVELVVTEGSVSFREQGAPEAEVLILQKDDKITFDQEEKSMTRSKADANQWWKKITIDRKLFEEEIESWRKLVKSKLK